jgi:hypothetical protein
MELLNRKAALPIIPRRSSVGKPLLEVGASSTKRICENTGGKLGVPLGERIRNFG